ncbi:hypothetical protein QE390_003675 [Siphonobacter sp. SORGH_AS 1065]|nr:hypothetical protein [Siphonobacter sp. SORGH_AS_1065]
MTCIYRIEENENPLTRQARYMDKPAELHLKQNGQLSIS